MQALLAAIAEKRRALDALRPLAAHAVAALDHLYDLELTWSSNAIEGNTLTVAETQLVIEMGITIAGKPLRDHLEALDHFDALHWVRGMAARSGAITEADLRDLHRLVMQRSQPDAAGRYADQGRFVLTDAGRHAFPLPALIPGLMGDFTAWLAAAPSAPLTAIEAHRRLVDIHPFNDGNGRTARLLMNLLLLRGGYPPVAIRPDERPAYIAALQAHQAGAGDTAFNALLLTRLDASLAAYLDALRQAVPR
ncbi:Fic family protein [Leptolyngbya sp. 15MV]|nr:Fic family protein [Leptolyngbya sp. 15MV]